MSQSMPDETRGVRGDRLAAHLRVDEVLGHEEVPVVGQLAEPLGPELDGVLAVGDEVLAGLVGA